MLLVLCPAPHEVEHCERNKGGECDIYVKTTFHSSNVIANTRRLQQRLIWSICK